MKKLSNYVAKILISTMIILAYCVFVKIIFNNLPIFKIKLLDYIGCLGLLSVIYLSLLNLRKDLYEIINDILN